MCIRDRVYCDNLQEWFAPGVQEEGHRRPGGSIQKIDKQQHAGLEGDYVIQNWIVRGQGNHG